MPCIVNPLIISVQSNGKIRLILDLRCVNLYVLKQRFNCEDIICTKIIRPLVKKWRGEGKCNAIYLDDGMGFAQDFELARSISESV